MGQIALYKGMYDRGELLLTPGAVVRVQGPVERGISAAIGQPDVIVADRWKERDLIQSLRESENRGLPYRIPGARLQRRR